MSTARTPPLEVGERVSSADSIRVDHEITEAGVIDATVRVEADGREYRHRASTEHSERSPRASGGGRFSQPWAWRCPRGHTGWRARFATPRSRSDREGSYYVCRTCQKADDPIYFEDLVHASEF
ncbi:hypothetical protein [Natronococcus roseus]|uniref:hypothetical protein n=1 Tax=Natronococcus roseus TaxID=1052014 RepID=UPI00374D8CA6